MGPVLTLPIQRPEEKPQEGFEELVEIKGGVITETLRLCSAEWVRRTLQGELPGQLASALGLGVTVIPCGAAPRVSQAWQEVPYESVHSLQSYVGRRSSEGQKCPS